MSGNFPRRRNWTPSLAIALLVAVVAAAVGWLADSPATATDRMYFRNTAGAVLFDHGAHSGNADSCATCHHTLYDGAQASTCASCHDDSYGPDDIAHQRLKQLHGNDCATCHAQSREDDEALSCRTCHPASQASETRTQNCTECHDDSFSPEMLSHDEYQEIEDHTCLGCHTPGAVSEVYHANCTPCHQQAAPEQFTTAGGEVNCGSCHLR